MRRTTVVATVITCLAVAGPAGYEKPPEPDGPPERLSLVPAVGDNLALLFAQFRTELVLCLEGRRDGEALRITDFRMPHILVSEPGRVQATGCSGNPSLVGTWHNHPGPGMSLVGVNPATVRRNCYLSRTDIADFLRRREAQVSVVSCGPFTYAYWWRHDVRDIDDDVPLLLPPPGQLVHTQDEGKRDNGALTQAR